MANPYDAFSDPVGAGPARPAAPAGDPYAAFSDPVGGSINFDRPDDQVRADIAKLSGEERKQALDQWATRFVEKERAQGGIGQMASDIGRTLARGTFVGPFLDEATAASLKVLQVATGGLAGSDYDEALAYQRAQDRAVDTAAPILSTVGKVAGGIAGGVAALGARGAAGAAVGGPLANITPAASLPGQIAQGVGVGAAYGATAGFGNAEGDARMGDAARGAVFGGAVGGVLPPVVAGASKVAATVSDAVSPSLARWGQQLDDVLQAAGISTTRPPTSAGAMAAPPVTPPTPAQAAADQVIANQLSRAGRTVTDLRQILAQADEARTFGPNSQAQNVLAPVDLDPSLQRLASSAARQQPEAGNIAASFITARQKGETPPVPLEPTAGLPTKLKMAPVDPNAPPMGQYERVKDALRRAFQINTSSTHGFGNTAARVEERMIDAAKKEAKDLYSAAYKAGSGVDLAPTVAPVVAKWRAAAVDETEDVAKVFEKFSSWVERAVAPAGVKHHIERFDKAKQLMDDEIDKAFRAGDRYLGGQMTQFKNELLDAVDAISANGLGPAYQKARDAFSSRMELREALDLGRRLFSENADVAVDQFRGLSSGQARMARIGIVDSFERRMAGQKRAADITQVFETPRVQEIIEAMIPRARATRTNPNPEFANRPERFGQYLANEQRMIGTRDEVLGNAKTAQRIADDQSMNSMVDMLDDIKRAGTSVTGAAMQFITNQVEKLFGFRADTAAEIARKLFTANPAERDRMLLAVEARIGPDRAAQFRQIMSDYHARVMQVGATTTSASVQTPNGPQQPQPSRNTPPDPRPMPPPMRLGGPKPDDQGGAPAAPDLASVAIDAGRRSDRERMRDTVSQIEPDPPEHWSRRQPRAEGGKFAPGKPAELKQGPEPRLSNTLADIALGYGLKGTADRLNDRTSGAGMIADAVGTVADSVGRALTAPVRAARGEIPPELMADEGMNVAGVAAGGSMPIPRPQNSVSMFWGPKANPNIAPRQDQVRAGPPAPDLRLTREVDAPVTPQGGAGTIGEAISKVNTPDPKISDIIDLGANGRAYPFLNDLPVGVETNPKAGNTHVFFYRRGGGFGGEADRIIYSPREHAAKGEQAAQEDLYKAIQMAIQHTEGMPTPGVRNPSTPQPTNSPSGHPGVETMMGTVDALRQIVQMRKDGAADIDILSAIVTKNKNNRMAAEQALKMTDEEIVQTLREIAPGARSLHAKEAFRLEQRMRYAGNDRGDRFKKLSEAEFKEGMRARETLADLIIPNRVAADGARRQMDLDRAWAGTGPDGVAARPYVTEGRRGMYPFQWDAPRPGR
jgi:hypothetical protein